MKNGDLVRINRKTVWLQKEDWNTTGIIVRTLSEEFHTHDGHDIKNKNFEVLWNSDNEWLPIWHNSRSIEVISEVR